MDEAKAQSYRAVLLGLWNPQSDEELNGIAALVKNHHKDFALAVCIGNEGIAFNRYKFEALNIAADKLRTLLGPRLRVPVCTSEPFGQYGATYLREFGDFLAPNIHPVFDRPELDPVASAEWVRQRALSLAESAHKPVLVKETGFPHGGAGRFTPETQKLFWDAYLRGGLIARTRTHTWVSYDAGFEAFDLPWKAAQTGLPIEAAWACSVPRGNCFRHFPFGRKSVGAHITESQS